MPSRHPELRLWRRAVLLPVALVPVLLTGCSTEEEPAPAQGPRHERKTDETHQKDPAPQPAVAPALDRALRDRAAAVRSADRAAFVAGIAGGDASFVADQTAYLENLDQLPLARFAYTLDPTSLARTGHDYWATVDLTMQ